MNSAAASSRDNRSATRSSRHSQSRRGFDAARGQWLAPEAGQTKVSQLAERWWSSTVDLAPSTRIRLRGVLDNQVLPAWGDRAVASIEHIEVREWVAGLVAGGLAPRSVRKIAQTFSKLLDLAVMARMIGANPCNDVPMPKVHAEEMRFLTAAEVIELADAIDERYRALVYVAGFGGLRFGELAGMRRGRVSILHGTVDVIETAVEAGGKVHVGPPKSKAGRRKVTLPTAATEALSEHLGRFVGPGPEDLVFTSPQGLQLRATTWRRRFFDPAVRAAGLEPLRPHDLRHTAVALWIASGDNVKAISTRAGHSSVAFTLDTYGHLMPDSEQLHRSRLDELIAVARRGQLADGVVRSLRG